MARDVLDAIVRRGHDTGVRRPADRRWVAGVCIGLAARYRVDPVLFRVGFIVLALPGVGVAAYLLAWLLLPAQDDSLALERALRRGDGAALTLLVLAVVATLALVTTGGADGGVSLLGLLVVGLGVWWYGRRSSSAAPEETATTPPSGIKGGIGAGTETASETGWQTAPRPGVSGVSGVPGAPGSTTPHRSSVPPAPTAGGGGDAVRGTPLPGWDPPAPAPAPFAAHRDPLSGSEPSRRGLAWASSLVTVGLAGIAYGLAAAALPRHPLTAMAAALFVLGAALVLTGLRGLRPPLVSLTAWLLGIGLVASATAPPEPPAETAWRPTTAAQVQSHYSTGVRSTLLDLTAAPVPPGTSPRDVRLSTGVGDVVVLLPDDVTTELDVRVGVGTVTVDDGGSTQESSDIGGGRQRYTVGRGRTAYRLTVDGGVGSVVVRTTAPTVPSHTVTRVPASPAPRADRAEPDPRGAWRTESPS